MQSGENLNSNPHQDQTTFTEIENKILRMSLAERENYYLSLESNLKSNFNSGKLASEIIQLVRAYDYYNVINKKQIKSIPELLHEVNLTDLLSSETGLAGECESLENNE